jgi:crossover junction endodeoxyribonuclease RuvC
MVILGIDPGTAITGYGVISTDSLKQVRNGDRKPIVIDFGCITTSKFDSPGDRLKIIYHGVQNLIKKHRPNIISVETLFFFKNAKTAMPVAQARGVVILAAAEHHIPVCEFTPLQVKMTVVGYGGAEKKQVQEMTKQLLDLSKFEMKEKSRKKDDASDALGVALCALFKNDVLARI